VGICASKSYGAASIREKGKEWRLEKEAKNLARRGGECILYKGSTPGPDLGKKERYGGLGKKIGKKAMRESSRKSEAARGKRKRESEKIAQKKKEEKKGRRSSSERGGEAGYRSN